MSLYAQRMKYVRRQLGEEIGVENLSQAKFAKLLDVNPSSISHVEAGITRIQPKLARAIEEKTGFRRAWLLTGDGPERTGTAAAAGDEARMSGEAYLKHGFSYVRMVKPILSAGSGNFVDDEFTEDIYSFRTDWLTRKGVVSAMRLARVSGDSMLPILADGDFVLFDTSKQDPLDGKIMAVGIENHLFIKRVRFSPEGIFLISENKAVYEPWRVNPENTRFLGLVIWHCGDV